MNLAPRARSGSHRPRHCPPRHCPPRHCPPRPCWPRHCWLGYCTPPRPAMSWTHCPRRWTRESPRRAASSPAASNRGSSWPARSPPTRRCWCSLSRRPRSTRIPKPRSPPAWRRHGQVGQRSWPLPARLCCHRPITWSSSTAAGLSRKAATRTWSPAIPVTRPPSPEGRSDMPAPATAPSARPILPIASRREVRAYARRLMLRNPWPLAAALALHGLAASAGLATPRLLGGLVQNATDGRLTLRQVDLAALAITGLITAQAVMARFAVYLSTRVGERVLAELREEFVRQVLRLPLSTVERAGSGDLLTRTTRDVDAMSRAARMAVPETLIAIVTGALAVAALLLNGPLLALPCLTAAPLLYGGTRWYLARAREGYLAENAAYAEMTEGLAETVAGARTVEALRTGTRRIARTDADIARAAQAERYTLGLRMVWIPLVELGYVIPVAATLGLGGLFVTARWTSIGQLTAATLYVQQLVDPLDRLLSWMDELQVGGASLARLLGVAQVPAHRAEPGLRERGAAEPGAAEPGHPGGEHLTADSVRYAYVAGTDVLHGIDLRLLPGERLAMVGPSGAGKSTLGRLLAGIHAPRAGAVTVGKVPLVELPLRELRGHVALVTQEHHVFLGTLRDNIALTTAEVPDERIRAALAAVDALEWVELLPAGLDTMVGSGQHELSPAQAQQVALARLVLADPPTLVLDEATSLLDPRAARHLERSLAAVLDGRTVVAIAHRLHTGRDADRVAVIEDGSICELGTHDELVAAGGAYAQLWRSWRG